MFHVHLGRVLSSQLGIRCQVGGRVHGQAAAALIWPRCGGSGLADGGQLAGARTRDSVSSSFAACQSPVATSLTPIGLLIPSPHQRCLLPLEAWSPTPPAATIINGPIIKGLGSPGSKESKGRLKNQTTTTKTSSPRPIVVPTPHTSQTKQLTNEKTPCRWAIFPISGPLQIIPLAGARLVRPRLPVDVKKKASHERSPSGARDTA